MILLNTPDYTCKVPGLIFASIVPYMVKLKITLFYSKLGTFKVYSIQYIFICTCISDPTLILARNLYEDVGLSGKFA